LYHKYLDCISAERANDSFFNKIELIVDYVKIRQ